MWIRDAVMILGMAILMISPVVAQVLWYRFSRRARAEGFIDDSDLRRTVARVLVIGLASAIGATLLGVSEITRSPEPVPWVQKILVLTLCFAAPMSAWLLMVPAMLAGLRYRMRRDRDTGS